MDYVNNKMKVSVIIPVYNVEKFLPKCAKSILEQTYKNIEIIFVDDGSTDSSGIICDEFAKIDSRVAVVHKCNEGLSSARNIGFRYASGEYITFVDSDDYISPVFIETALNLCFKFDADISILKMIFVDEFFNGFIPQEQTNFFLKMNSEKAIKESLIQRYFSCSACGKLFKRKIIEGILFPNGRLSEDLAVCHLFFDKSNCIVFSEQIGYYYRQRSGSIMHDFNLKRLDVLDWSSSIELFCKDKYPNITNFARCRSFNVSIHLLFELPKNRVGSSAEFIKIWNEIKRCRLSVLLSRECRFKEKIVAILSLFGPRLPRYVWRNLPLFMKNTIVK